MRQFWFSKSWYFEVSHNDLQDLFFQMDFHTILTAVVNHDYKCKCEHFTTSIFLQQHQNIPVEYTCKPEEFRDGWVIPSNKLAIDTFLLFQLLHVYAWVYGWLLRSLPDCATSWPLSQNTVTITHIPWIVNERTNYRSASDTPLHNYQSKAVRLSVALQRRANQSIT